jgi:hypothetical protein
MSFGVGGGCHFYIGPGDVRELFLSWNSRGESLAVSGSEVELVKGELNNKLFSVGQKN